jgi:hypothetical protein
LGHRTLLRPQPLGRDQFAALSTALQGLQGRFILSLNDVPEVRALFAWASIETVELIYQAGGAENTKRVREIVISGPRGWLLGADGSGASDEA